ncbi:hypothetical protein LQ762_06930 [Bacillus cereus]|nr:hypothetical protein [Bacillus cereus]
MLGCKLFVFIDRLNPTTDPSAATVNGSVADSGPGEPISIWNPALAPA